MPLMVIGALLFLGNLMGYNPGDFASGAIISLLLIGVGFLFAVDKDKRQREEKEREIRERQEAEDDY